jgi:hypothetical protein
MSAFNCARCAQPIQPGQLYQPRSSWGGPLHVSCPNQREIEHAQRMGRAS